MELRAHLVLQPLWQWLSYSCSLSRRGRYVYEAQLLWNSTAKEMYVPLFKSPVMTRTMKPPEHEQCYHLTFPNGCHWLLWLDSFVVSLILFLHLFFVSEIKCLSLSWWRLVDCGSTRDVRCLRGTFLSTFLKCVEKKREVISFIMPTLFWHSNLNTS